MPKKEKATHWVKVTLTADKSTPSCQNVKSALLELQHQGYPMCWPSPDMKFNVDVAKAIGPHIADALKAGTTKKNS